MLLGCLRMLRQLSKRRFQLRAQHRQQLGKVCSRSLLLL
jgi:hypothetical protein